MKKRGQAAAEATMIIAILLIILLSILTFNESFMIKISGSHQASKMTATADRILQAATFVYHQGAGAKTVIFVNLPEEMESVELTGNIINITVNVSNNINNIYRKTDFKLNGTMPGEPGNYCLLIESFRGYVEVTNFNASC